MERTVHGHVMEQVEALLSISVFLRYSHHGLCAEMLLPSLPQNKLTIECLPDFTNPKHC